MRGVMLRNKPNFTGCLARSVNDQIEFNERMIAERLGQGAASLVVTDGPHENATHAKRYKITRDVTGAADHQLGAFDGDDRRRRLRRYARNLAVNKLVQHQIANAEHGLLGQRAKVLVKI